MYSFQRSENVPGVKQPVRMGYPENTYPDICLCTDTSLHNYIALNSAMLRDALLNSKQLLESMGLKVVDIKAAKVEAEIIKAKAEKKPATKKKEKVQGVTGSKGASPDDPKGIDIEDLPSVTKGDKEGDDEWS